MITEKHKQLVAMFRRNGFVRPREVEQAGVPRWALYELAGEGVVTRQGRGIYVLPNAPITENHSYAEAIKRVPRGIICLISALRFHGLTMQNAEASRARTVSSPKRKRITHPARKTDTAPPPKPCHERTSKRIRPDGRRLPGANGLSLCRLRV